jgi:stress response protein YsnF
MASQVTNERDIVKGRPFVRRYTRTPETPAKKEIRLCEEHVRVAHHPMDRPAPESDLAAITGGTIELAATAEEPVASQHVRVVEEVVVSTDVEERTKTVRGPVRLTEVDVEPLGRAQVQKARDKASTIRNRSTLSP